MTFNSPPTFMNKTVWVLLILLLVLIIYYLINIGNNFVEDNKKIKVKKKRVLPLLASMLILYFFYTLTKKYSILSDTIFTIIISAVLAYLFNPIINFLEKKKIKRVWGVLIVYLAILGVIFILSFLVIPKTGKELKNLVVNLPSYFKQASQAIDELYIKYYLRTGDFPPIFQRIEEIVMENIAGIENVILNSLKRFFDGVLNTFSKVISLIMIPILTLYFLTDKDYFKSRLLLIVPKKYRNDIKNLFIQIDRSLSQFVRGRLLMALYVGVATTIMLIILGVDFAVVTGFITGIADIVPYFGPFLGFIPAVFFAFLKSPIKALWVSIFFLVIQWVENNILAPKIIGDSTGIHPITILLAIIIGGGMFGVLGMIFSIPVVAIFKILYAYLLEKFRKPDIFDK
ncbi:AI-2E family transporter [Tissierella sp. MSJ-40]|uniref:AI-2E family transporter n=1 Tax=Tissierella simiarum TaxID=2841534 RepID=A0ABS6EB99_9FIRM|nr:AI-2E family transporter [Tissierella simiarum]MBU5440206.1 AI-2E family transporter [Tissierella simiarum]